MKNDKKKIAQQLESRPIRVCVVCQAKLEEVKNFGRKFLVCANPKCPRIGLVTVVFAQLRKKHESENSEHEGLQPENV